MENFNEFNIEDWLKKSLLKMGYEKPTPIQAQSIPESLSGSDILGTAQTGTGKTAAFLIPLINHLCLNSGSTALVLTPTRELAKQVHTVAIQMLSGYKGLQAALIIGGDSMQRQFYELRRCPRLIVGTPGRVTDHLHQKTLSLRKASFVVLDETDRMLDMGFGIQIDEVFKHIECEKQTLLFSATLPKEILEMSKRYLVSPKRIEVGSVNTVAINIEQELIQTREKNKVLVEILEQAEGSSIIFVRTQKAAEILKDKLTELGLKSDTLHGGLRQNKRNIVIQNFRREKFNILVATDIASRGLDIPHIRSVINYDLPDNPEDYVHRIGRTARNEQSGKAYNLVNPLDNAKWNAIQKFLGNKTAEKLPEDQSVKKGRGGFKSQGSKFFGNKDRSFGPAKSRGPRPPHHGQREHSNVQRAPRDRSSDFTPAFLGGQNHGNNFGDSSNGRPAFRKQPEIKKEVFYYKDGEQPKRPQKFNKPKY